MHYTTYQMLRYKILQKSSGRRISCFRLGEAAVYQRGSFSWFIQMLKITVELIFACSLTFSNSADGFRRLNMFS